MNFQVSVKMDSGNEQIADVAWENVGGKLAANGAYLVKGTVKGTEVPEVCTVSAKKKPPNGAFLEDDAGKPVKETKFEYGGL